MSDEKRSILEEAQEIIHGDRNRDYGHPLDNHECTAGMFGWYMRRRVDCCGDEAEVLMDAEAVCVFNILQKISRLANTPGHRDSLMDIAGYAGNIEMVTDERERRSE